MSKVLDLKVEPTSGPSFDFKHKLHYLSVHLLNSREFGHARVMREVTEAWMDGKIATPGLEFNSQPPPVPAEELARVPGAEIAMGNIDKLKMEVLVRENTNLVINRDETKYWRSIQDGFADEFEKLFKEHAEKFATCPVLNGSLHGFK